jgi:hypothetical protein
MLLPRQARPPVPVLSRDFLAEDHGTRIIILTAVITGVSFLVVFLRVYVRAVTLKTVGSDDYTVSKLVLVEQDSTNFVYQMMIAIFLTSTAFCSWSIPLFCGRREARGWTQYSAHLLGSCSCREYFAGR